MKDTIKRGLVPVNNLYLKSTRWLVPQAQASTPGGRSLFVAPHQDDEVLGCGGTIAVHCRLKRQVFVAYLSNGTAARRSPKIAPDDLSALRKAEAREAMDTLGVPEENVFFLDVRDGNFPRPDDPAGAAAVKRLADIMKWQRPDEVYAPFRLEPNGDHRAAYAIFAQAMKKANVAARQREYPVRFWERGWFWQMRPAWWRRRVKLDIAAVLQLKKQALAAYRSQTTDMLGPDRQRLSSQFLQNFFHPYEIFWEIDGDGRPKETVHAYRQGGNGYGFGFSF